MFTKLKMLILLLCLIVFVSSRELHPFHHIDCGTNAYYYSPVAFYGKIDSIKGVNADAIKEDFKPHHKTTFPHTKVGCIHNDKYYTVEAYGNKYHFKLSDKKFYDFFWRYYSHTLLFGPINLNVTKSVVKCTLNGGGQQTSVTFIDGIAFLYDRYCMGVGMCKWWCRILMYTSQYTIYCPIKDYEYYSFKAPIKHFSMAGSTGYIEYVFNP